jgi:acyl-homoserine lactone acylase PvdQ
MHVTLRDFRSHVGQLIAIGLADTARRLAQDYVDAYARGLNRYIRELQHITLASHAD